MGVQNGFEDLPDHFLSACLFAPTFQNHSVWLNNNFNVIVCRS